MFTVLIGAALIGLLGIVCVVLLVMGIANRKRSLVYIAAGIFMACLAAGTWLVVTIATKSVNKASQFIEPRSGREIYTALFGPSDNSCISVKESQDQVIPKIDVAIWLHFGTCPKEIKRILGQKDYQSEFTATAGWNTGGPSANENWFKPERMGDTIWVFTHRQDSFGNGQTLYVSRDSTEAYCKDVWD